MTMPVNDKHEGPEDDEQEFDAPEEGGSWDEEAEELDLDDEEPLPWLESSDYEEEEGVDAGRIFGFVILMLLALGIVLGLWWYFTNRGVDPELAADGSTIAAEEGDYKERPEDPGGKEFAGTGDVAPAVGEGQTREGRIADGSNGSAATGGEGEAARPSVDRPSTSEAAGSTSAAVVQVAAIGDRSRAEEKWQELSRRSSALQGFKYRVEEARIDNGTVYRIQALAGSKAAADKLCRDLRADGVDCIVK